MMQGPWFGIVLMVGMVVGLAWWCWWTMRKDKDKEEKN
jgi:cytochrome bd-type quinol oxidase subunit 2